MDRTTYTNQWHKPNQPEYGPAVYETDAPAEEYREFEIYNRQAAVWDVVKDGVCVSQCAGINGAKRQIDNYLDGTGIHYLSIPDAEPVEDDKPTLPRPGM
jgi:hypothetical protein